MERLEGGLLSKNGQREQTRHTIEIFPWSPSNIGKRATTVTQHYLRHAIITALIDTLSLHPLPSHSPPRSPIPLPAIPPGTPQPSGGNDEASNDGGATTGAGATFFSGTTISSGPSRANTSTVFFQAASITSLRDTPFNRATTHATPPIAFGSFRPFTIFPSTNVFADAGKKTSDKPFGSVLRCAFDACVAFKLHHGASVSNIRRSNGIAAAATKFSAVFSPQPFKLKWKPISIYPGSKHVRVCPNQQHKRSDPHQFLYLLLRSSKGMYDPSSASNCPASVFAKALLAKDLDEVGMCCSRVEEQGQVVLLSEAELHPEVFALGFGRRPEEAVIVWPKSGDSLQ